ncbi:MAG: hypothetical protein HY699_05870 [Deltaproteobacteria bacterium]|nr:hypothetical protein [Deltaproteobacteria bacterium]
MDNQDRPAPPAASAPADQFYRGRIVRLSSGRQSGVVQSYSTGREIPFAFAHVVVLGDKRRFDDLHIATEVAYDVSWTSSGLRISVMKILN